MNELGIVLGLMFVLILLIFVVLVNIAYHVSLGVDIHLETVKCYQMLSEIQRINENIYYKLDELQEKEEDDCK